MYPSEHFRRQKGANFAQVSMGKETIEIPVTPLITKGLAMKGSIQ